MKPVLADHVAFVTSGPGAETLVFLFQTSAGSVVKALGFSRNYIDCLVQCSQLI